MQGGRSLCIEGSGTVDCCTPEPTMGRSVDSIERQIAKLLQLAKDQNGTPEGEAASRIARKRMRESARSRAQQWSKQPEITVQQRRLELGARWPWRRRLAAAVARHCACVAAWPTRGTDVVLFGAVGALDIAAYLLAVLLREVDSARMDWLLSQEDYDPNEPASPDLARRTTGFCSSAVGSIEARLRTMRREESKVDPTGHALVLDEAVCVRTWLDDQGITLKKGAPSPYSFSADGWNAGHEIALHDAMEASEAPSGKRIQGRTHRPTRRGR